MRPDEAFALAERLLAEHGPPGWSVELDGAKRRAGVCLYRRRVIGISAPLAALQDESEVRDTVLHEIAHALVGPRHGHDATWRATAVGLGCSGRRCLPADAPRPPEPWLGVCPAGHVRGRYRRPERVMTCGGCSPRFDVAHVFTWTHHGRPAPMHPNYDAELAALRDGTPMRLLPVGARARVLTGGEFHGLTGRVVRHGRTSYHLQTARGVLRVPFAAAGPAR